MPKTPKIKVPIYIRVGKKGKQFHLGDVTFPANATADQCNRIMATFFRKVATLVRFLPEEK